MTEPRALFDDLFRANVPYNESLMERFQDVFNALLERAPIVSWLMQTQDRNLTNANTIQKLFDEVTNGALTLETGVYHFESFLYLTTMSATSGNAAFDVLGGGTATCDRHGNTFVGIDNDTPLSAGAWSGSGSVTKATVASAVSAGTGSGLIGLWRGMFRVSARGTIIPSVTLVTANAAVLKAGSYFKCEKISETQNSSAGVWA